MDFLNSFIWFKGKNNGFNFNGDLRIGSNIIMNAITRKYPIVKIGYLLLKKLKDSLFFSNIFISTKFSNLYIKKIKNEFIIFSKKNSKNENKMKKIFNYLINDIYNILKNENLIYPFKIKKILRPGNDFHYCGTLNFMGNSPLSVDKNCQLKKHKNFYIVDSSVFDFKKNLFPLGLVISNSMRVAQNIIEQDEI